MIGCVSCRLLEVPFMVIASGFQDDSGDSHHRLHKAELQYSLRTQTSVKSGDSCCYKLSSLISIELMAE